jgi:hypothetical protein
VGRGVRSKRSEKRGGGEQEEDRKEERVRSRGRFFLIAFFR